MLLFLCEKYNYQTPVFLTFNQAKEAGVKVLKGSESFPVYYTMYCAYHLETKVKISLEEFKTLPEEEQKEYRVVSNTKYYLVFNLDQTNYSEIHPEKWEILRSKFTIDIMTESSENTYSNIILDSIIKNQNWVCPIELKASNKAFWSFADKIVLPLKGQFNNGESYYCTALHEMAHSTGTKERLNRKGFYENDKKIMGEKSLLRSLQQL